MGGKDPIATALAAIVEAGVLAGAATLIWRDGQVVQTAAVGWRDVEAGLPMERSTLFRIASMTKPVTSTAALMLLEEGRYTLDEPIARWAPEFSRMPFFYYMLFWLIIALLVSAYIRRSRFGLHRIPSP